MSCLDDICDVVSRSTEISGINQSQLVGDQTGHVVVKTYDWTGYLKNYFRPFVVIKLHHHFRFGVASRGDIFVKELVSSEEEKFNIKNKDLSIVVKLPLLAGRYWQ